MAKRKTKKAKLSRTQIIEKRRGKLAKEFLCYYCQHEKSVSVKISSDKAHLSCRICGIKFFTKVTLLDEPIDVYTIWIDACREGEKLQSPTKKQADPTRLTSMPSQPKDKAKTAEEVPKSSVPQRVVVADSPANLVSSNETSLEQMQAKNLERHRREELPPSSFSKIGGSIRSKRIIDALDESPDEPEFTVDTLTGDNLFDDD